MHGKARLAGSPPVIALLSSHRRSKLWMVSELINDLFRRPGAPFRKRAAVPPVKHVACDFWHHTGRENLVHLCATFAQCVGPGLDCLCLIGDADLQIPLLGFVRARERQKLCRSDIQDVIDRSQ